MYLKFYLEQIGFLDIPDFLVKYLDSPSLLRLKKVGYFCGMDFASKKIYQFREYISRFDHSLTVCLLVYKLTNDKKACLAGLFHDIATPCFSHVIDYMNKDYEKQESTEEYTESIIKNDEHLMSCLKNDGIDIEDVIDFKKYSVVDNNRPKVCADRLDGVILTGIGWTKNLTKREIKTIIDDIDLFINEDGEEEIGFKTYKIAEKVLSVSKSIDLYCHSKEDNYMMELLADITRLAISKGYIKYIDLYKMDESKLFSLLKNSNDSSLEVLIYKFENIDIDEIPDFDMPQVKVRDLNPLVNGVRIK